MVITNATVLLTNSADQILLDTDMPCPYNKAFAPEQTPLQLEFKASYNTGVEYVREVFQIEPEVINVR